MDITINSSGDYSADLQENDRIKSITQNIALLLNTRQGTIPMYREFGLPMEFIDKPADAAETIAVSEISEALEKFEPRAVLKDLSLKSSGEGKTVIVLEVTV